MCNCLIFASGEQAMEMERLLSAADREEQALRKFQMQQLKDSWNGALTTKELARTKVPDQDVDFNNLGSSAAQQFMGEDANRSERLRLQKEQMYRWVQEQLAEKAYFKEIEKAEDLSYAEMMRAVDEIRESHEKEEFDMRKYIQEKAKIENKTVKYISGDLILKENN